MKLNDLYISVLNESVQLKIMKNLEKAPYMGSRFGQDVEPSGIYVTEKDFDGEITGNYAVGMAYLQNPLYINVNDNNLIKYKNELSNKFKSKGKSLTKKLMKLGYDAIICVLPNGDSGEIVLFPNAKFMLNKV